MFDPLVMYNEELSVIIIFASVIPNVEVISNEPVICMSFVVAQKDPV